MVQVPRPTASSAPTLVRLLARLAQLDVAEPGQSLPDQLSQWLGWTDAIALSTALNATAYGAASDAASVADLGDDASAHTATVRTSLIRRIDAACGFATGARHAAKPAALRGASSDAVPDYADFRHRYVGVQHAMATDIGALRGRLRTMLVTRAPDMAQLCAVDTVMEQALAAREHHLLANVPALLGAHFARLRDAASLPAPPAQTHVPQQACTQVPLQTDAPTPAGAPGSWLDVFRNDMRSVLIAELDVRFQPVQGLLSAYRTC
ncbi:MULTISPECIES: DUF3348 domain-containing protein [Burkholderiaceae]|uniref:DUF3348 domain-containing protein n=1 Tax=Burkholderiaceae TaxID=119060 RepID=UPI000962439C|nr:MULTISPECIES: DUF3348 domain-containing protein [Burkholderiaceae]MCF2134050.1 DUF3348 domain-containing protein [Mycetohabitans sp. B3]MCG1039601.1 DUF3348 domain-containing protein [Mycetohabitans sp. B7]SIT70031.1 Protein of unknown function [Burkholderia sp. b14]